MSEFDELTPRSMALLAASRAELAELLMRSLKEQDNIEIKAVCLIEICRRDQEISAGATVIKPADQVLREARERLRCM